MPAKRKQLLKKRAKGFLGDAWNWVKDRFKKGDIGRLAKTVGDITGNKKISDIGSKVQSVGSKVTKAAESVGFGKRKRAGMINPLTSAPPILSMGYGKRMKHRSRGGLASKLIL